MKNLGRNLLTVLVVAVWLAAGAWAIRILASYDAPPPRPPTEARP